MRATVDGNWVLRSGRGYIHIYVYVYMPHLIMVSGVGPRSTSDPNDRSAIALVAYAMQSHDPAAASTTSGWRVEERSQNDGNILSLPNNPGVFSSRISAPTGHRLGGGGSLRKAAAYDFNGTRRRFHSKGHVSLDGRHFEHST